MRQKKLRECYAEHSYYYLTLEPAMKRIINGKGLGSISGEIIEAFCEGETGDHLINSANDYNYVLDRFQHFMTGIVWALTQHPSTNQKSQ